VKQPPPICPACGSNATLPFESDDPASDGQSVVEVILGASFFLLSLLVILLFFLLSNASLPAAVLLLMTLLLYWRRRVETRRRAKSRQRPHVCLDCSRDFLA